MQLDFMVAPIFIIKIYTRHKYCYFIFSCTIVYIFKHNADTGFNRCASMAFTGDIYSSANLYVSMDFITSCF